jgi:hypothetical protein
MPTERLAVLALAGTEDERGADGEALAHVSTCQACAAKLSQLVASFDDLRDEAHHEADARFPEAALEAQRTRVLDRLAHIGHAARVLPFPMRASSANPVRPVVNRRWVSAAAAAGLLIGLVTGQVMHVTPWERARHVEQRVAAAPVAPGFVPIGSTASLTDYVSLTEVDSAVQLRRAADVVMFDTLTPSLSDIP